MYYSWYSITSPYVNSQFQIVWPAGAGTTTFTITIPNGFYTISDLNSYLQKYCITNGLYLINVSGQYLYYCEFLTNSNYYAIQFNAYSVPTSLPAGWT